MSAGGISSIRGFSQNQSLADSGLIGSTELRIPLLKRPEVLQLTPFIDGGLVWNNFEANPSPRSLLSIGLGVRGELWKKVQYRLDFALPLLPKIGTGTGSLQEMGLLFSLKYQPL